MNTVFAIVLMLQADPQIFEFSVVVHTMKQCEAAREVLRRKDQDLYNLSLCVEMKLPRSKMRDVKPGEKDGAEAPQNRPAKPKHIPVRT